MAALQRRRSTHRQDSAQQADEGWQHSPRLRSSFGTESKSLGHLAGLEFEVTMVVLFNNGNNYDKVSCQMLFNYLI